MLRSDTADRFVAQLSLRLINLVKTTVAKSMVLKLLGLLVSGG